MKLAESVTVKAVSHITGGGFYENIPRSLPQGVTACIDVNSIGPIPLFERIASAGRIPLRDMYNTFNMGIGMVLTVSSSQADEAVRVLQDCGEDPRVIGEIVPGDERVTLI